MRTWLRFAFPYVLLPFSLGCAGQATPVTPAEGVILLNGKPAHNLLIQFSSTTASGKGSSATAVSDESGRYVLVSDDGRRGVAPGTHKVTVVDNNVNAEEDHPMSGKVPKVVLSRVRPGYASVTTTPLEVKVEAAKKEYPLEVHRR